MFFDLLKTVLKHSTSTLQLKMKNVHKTLTTTWT